MFSIPETMYFESQLLSEGTIIKPRMAVVHNSYRCNQNCKYCFFHQHNCESKTAGKVMPTDKLIGLVDQFARFGIKSLDLCGGGEPLMDENIDKVFNHATARGMKSCLLTNGILLKDRIMESVIDNCTWVRISVDSVNRELYKLVRGSDDCETVLDNIKKAIAYKSKTKSNCEISVKISLYKGITLSSIQEFFNYFKNLGINNIQIKHVWDKDGQYYKPDISKEDIGKLQAHGNQIVRKIHYSRYMAEQCWINPIHCVIDAIGDVYICCYYQGREDEHKIGNVFETPFEKIWASPLHRERLSKIKTKECLKHDCRFQKYMAVIRKAQKHGSWDFV